MKEPHVEGIAIHDDPESSAVTREGAGEALTGALAGWVLSREKSLQGSDAVETVGRRNGLHRHGEVHAGLRGPRPHARWETFCTGTGRSLDCLAGYRQAAAGRHVPVSADERSREVRPAHSTREATEQTRTTRRGGCGRRGRGQGNRRSAEHGPDSEPGNRIEGAGLRTRGGVAEQA